MPKFRVTSPDGRTFDVDAPDGATQEEAIAYVQQNFYNKSSGTVEKTSIPKDIGDKLFDITQDILVRGPSLGAGGVAGVISDLTGNEDAGTLRDIYFDKVQELTKKRKERDSALDRGEGGKIVGALTTIPFALTGPGAASILGTSALDTGVDLVNEGASAEQALAGAGFDLASGAAMYALGPATNVIGRVANAGLQAGINVAQEAGLNRPVQNMIRENADLRRLPDMTIGDYAAAAVPGAVFGAISPKKGKPRETPLPEDTPSVDVDKAYVARKEATLHSVEKQVLMLEKQIASIKPRDDGTYSEKQMKFIQSLEEQKQGKIEEATRIQKNIAAYSEPDQAAKIASLSTEDMIGEKVGSDTTVNKQKGSWTPFADMDDGRPDDSNAPGIMRPQNEKKRFGFKKFTKEQPPEDFRNPRHKQPPPPIDEGLTMAEWAVKDDGIDPFGKPPNDSRELAIYNQKRVELERAGIIEPSIPEPTTTGRNPTHRITGYERDERPIGNGLTQVETNKPVLEPEGRFRQRVFGSSTKANNYVKRLEGQVESMKKKYDKLRKAFDESTSVWDSETRTTMPVTEDVLAKAGSDYLDALIRLGRYKSKDLPKETTTQKTAMEKEYEKQIALGKTPEEAMNIAKWKAPVDTTAVKEAEPEFKPELSRVEEEDQVTKIVNRSMDDLNRSQDVTSRKTVLGTMFERLLGDYQGQSETLARSGISLREMFDSIARTHGVERGEGGKVPLLYYDKEGYIGLFDIPKDLQGNGIGRQIWETVQKETGRDKFYLLSRPDAVGFWKEMGFDVDEGSVGKFDDKTPMVKGNWNPFSEKGALDNANKTRVEDGLDPLPPAPKGPGFKQHGSIDLFASTEKAKETDTAAIATRLKNPQFDKIVDVTNLRPAEEMLAEMGNGQAKDYGGFLTKGERAMFGFQQFVEAVKRKAPLVWEQAKRIRQAENGEVEAKRLIWHGSNTGTGFQGFGPFTKLKHSQNPDSMETLLPNLSKNDKIVLTEFLVKNSEERIRHDKADMSGLTDFQQKAVGIIQKFYDSVHSLGGTRYRNGYVHALRDGDFAVGIKTSKGDLFHVEPAKTKELAAKMQKFLKEKGYNTTDIIDFKAEEGNPLGDSFSTVKDVLESLKDRLPDTESGTALRALDDVQQFIADHATPGRHNVRASLYTGFKGTSLVKGRAANAEDFFNGFKNYLDEVAAQTKKNKLTEETTKFWESDAGRKLKEEFPNQYDTAMYLTDVSMNKNQTYEPVKAFDEKARSVINTLTEKAMKKFGKNTDPFYYPEVPVLDRTIGLAAQLFYIRTLTSRPAFWAGQILSSPFATRQFLKEGTVLDTLVAQGKAWGTIMSGGDKDFKNFFNEIRQSSDTIRPQFIVDINRVPLFEDIKHPTLNKIFMWGTGQEQAGIADATSRYFTLAMAYHFYKDQGLSGSKLKENATNMAELTMQMYNRANSPPVLNKLGILGQNIAPLQKFGLGQLQNLIGDIRYMMDQPGFAQKIRGSLPALSTLMVTTIMGGAQGVSLLTEYEVLRYLLVKAGSAIGEDWSELFPSALENMMKHQNWFQKGVQKGYEGLGASEQFAKDASTHGLPSAATGFDIGSSLRFNPYVGEGLIKQNYSPIDNFPLVKQMIDMAVTTSVKTRKVLGGDVDEAEDRKADLSMQVFTGQNYLIDKFKHKSDTRAFVPGGGRLYGQVPQTKKEQIGQIIGSPSLETAKARKTVELMDRKEKQIAQKRQDAIDLLADAVTEGNQKGIDRAIELALKAEMDHKQIMQGLKAAMAQRNKSRLDAMTTNQKGFPSSKEQKRKYMERLQYE